MIKFKKLHKDAMLPVRKTVGSAGFDLYSRSAAFIHHGSVTMISTGISCAIPEGYVGIIKPRSGLAIKHGIDVMAGVIDSDYRGEIKVLLTTHDICDDSDISIGDRIAQMIVVPVMLESVLVDDLDETVRSDNGFGHTGV